MAIYWDATTGDSIEFEVQKISLAGVQTTMGTTQDTEMVFANVPTESSRFYRVRARIVNTDTLNSDWTEYGGLQQLGYVHTPPPFGGHQGDHTVQYELGSIAPTRHWLPPDDYDPSDAIANMIPFGRDAWNNSIASTTEPHILICEAGPACDGRHNDRKVVTISAAESGCSDGGIACVNGTRDTSTGHLKDLDLIIMEPYEITSSRSKRAYKDAHWLIWTDDPTLHLTLHDTKIRYIWVYLGDTMMHEFGHTLGLADLYGLGFFADVRYRGWLMKELADNKTSIPNSDIEYLKEVYQNHRPHGP